MFVITPNGKVQGKKFDKILTWHNGLLACERNYMPKTNKVLLFDIERGDIQTVSELSLNFGSGIAILLSSREAIVLGWNNISHIDMHNKTQTLLNGAEHEGFISSGIIAGSNAFVSTTRATRTTEIEFTNLRAGSLWKVQGRGIYDMFSWHPAVGNMVICSYQNIYHKMLHLANPRRQTHHLLDKGRSMRMYATPSTLCGMPVVLDVNLDTSKTTVLT
jgi:hypothetical protein